MQQDWYVFLTVTASTEPGMSLSTSNILKPLPFLLFIFTGNKNCLL